MQGFGKVGQKQKEKGRKLDATDESAIEMLRAHSEEGGVDMCQFRVWISSVQHLEHRLDSSSRGVEGTFAQDCPRNLIRWSIALGFTAHHWSTTSAEMQNPCRS